MMALQTGTTNLEMLAFPLLNWLWSEVYVSPEARYLRVVAILRPTLKGPSSWSWGQPLFEHFKELRGHANEVSEAWYVSHVQFLHDDGVGPQSSICWIHGLTHILCLLLGLGADDAGCGGAGAWALRLSNGYSMSCCKKTKKKNLLYKLCCIHRCHCC